MKTRMELNLSLCLLLTRILVLFRVPFQQGVQGSGVVLHDPVGDAAQERVGVDPGTVVPAAVPVAAQNLLIKEALAGGRLLKVGFVQSSYNHGQLEILHLFHQNLDMNSSTAG